jgi:hypothetical protein
MLPLAQAHQLIALQHLELKCPAADNHENQEKNNLGANKAQLITF